MDGDGPLPPFTARLPPGEPWLTDAETAAYRSWWSRRAADLLPRQNPIWPWLGGSVLALAGAGLCVRLDVVDVRDGGLVVVLLLGAYIAGSHAAGWRTTRYWRRWNKAQGAGWQAANKERRFVLDGDGVSVVSDTARSWTGWPEFREAHVAANVLLLRIGRAEDAVPIPLRAFPSPEAAEAAVAYAKGKVVLPAAGPGG